MKTRKEIPILVAAALFIILTPAGGFAEVDLGNGYVLSGDIEAGGMFLINRPAQQDKGYFEEYIPYLPGAVLERLDFSLTNKNDDRDYYRFFMSRPGYKDEDFFFQAGRIGLYSIEAEYDQFQHIYSTVNPFVTDIGTVIQRFRFSGTYTPTPDIDIYADYHFLKRNGEFPSTTIVQGPPNAYAFTSNLKPIDYTQNDLNIGTDYAQPMYQFHLGYYLSLFDDGVGEWLANPASLTAAWQSGAPSNMAQYINGTGAVNLPQCANTRLTANFTYGWLNQNDTVYQENGTTLYPSNFPAGVAGTPIGTSNLSASTFAGDFIGVTRPNNQWTIRYSYHAYDFQNDNLNNSVLVNSFFGSNGVNVPLLRMEQYSYLRQAVNFGADYRITSYAAVDLGYAYDSVDRDFNEGNSDTNTGKVGLRLYPCDWLNVIANYAHSERSGSDFLEMPSPISNTSVLTYKFYSGDDRRDIVNFIAEFFPLNNLTFSVNFNLYTDQYENSGYGLLNDRGWSAGADVSWTVNKNLTLSLGYDHEDNRTKELADNSVFNVAGTSVTVLGDAGPTLLTTNAYDTVSARADLVIIPNRLTFSTRAAFSYSASDFHNPITPNLNEAFTHLDNFLTYRFDQHWAAKLGYMFERFTMSSAYQTLYLNGINDSGVVVANQSFNTLEGFYRDYTAHVMMAFIQYKF